jgi:hypothetical protein
MKISIHEESWWPRARPFALLGAALLCLLFAVGTAYAVKTDHWELRSAQGFMSGKLQRLIVTSDGELRLGYGSTKLGEFAKEIWCSAVGHDGTIYFGTGSTADVYALGKDGKATKLFEADSIAVTALTIDPHGNLYAATMPEGKIYKIPTGGKTVEVKSDEPFCKLRAPYVWSLVVDKQGGLFAGTGPDGKVFRIGTDGKAEEWFAAEDANILSLALDADGALLAGGSDRGLLYRIAEKGKGVVLHEFAEDEVRALAVHGDDVYVGVNKQKLKRPRGAVRRPSAADFEDLTQRLTSQFGAAVTTETGGRDRETPPEARLANLSAGTLYVWHAGGRVDRLANWDDESILDIKVDGDGAVLAGMSGKGRVYRVRDSQNWDLLFDFDEQQALTLALRDGKLAFVGTGNIGDGYAIDAQRASDGELTSEVRDCRFFTTWGNLLWMGNGAITVATRTGNTALPDSTWSEWSEPLKTSPSKVTSPRGRFIQVRAHLATASDPVLQSLSLYYQIQNQKPEVSSIEVGEKPKPASEKPKHGSSTDSKSDESDAESAISAAFPQADSTSKAEDARPKAATSIKDIHWHATDKDGDTLVYRLYYQADGDDAWVPAFLEKPLHKTEYSWDTESIPDGWYRIKLVASDEESNPAGEALTDEKVSDRVKVDNTRPQVLQLAYDAAGGILKGVARDNLSLIRYLEFSVDGGEWKFFAPKDGVFDDREEAFEVKIATLSTGPHSIAVRATDEEGNVGVEKVSVRGK